MKTKTVLLIILLAPILAMGQVWDYPIKPGTEKWNNLITEKERIEAVQIPDSVLRTLTNDNIIDMCVKFPLFGYYTAFNTPQEGFDVMVSQFNIFKEVFKRKNIGGGIIEVYKDAGINGFKNRSYPVNFWTIKLNYLELILSQNDFLQTLSQKEKLDLLSESRKKISEKFNSDSFSSIEGVQTSLLIMARILNHENYLASKKLSNKQAIIAFINTGQINDLTTVDEISKLASDFIKTSK